MRVINKITNWLAAVWSSRLPKDRTANTTPTEPVSKGLEFRPILAGTTTKIFMLLDDGPGELTVIKPVELATPAGDPYHSMGDLSVFLKKHGFAILDDHAKAPCRTSNARLASHR